MKKMMANGNTEQTGAELCHAQHQLLARLRVLNGLNEAAAEK